MNEQKITSIISVQNELPIIKLEEYRLTSHVKGYHEYKGIWKPEIGDVLKTKREPENKTDKLAVAVMKEKEKGLVIGHLKKGKSGKFAKLFSYFLKNECSSCEVIIKGKPVNFGDGEGMQVPCELVITGYKLYLDILKKEVVNIGENTK